MSEDAKRFADLCGKYGTDKHCNHNCSYMYSEILKPFMGRARPIKLLEIGIEFGGSLRMWRDYIRPHPVLFGIDVSEEYCGNAPPEAKAFCGSQIDTTFLAHVVKETGGYFDVIIDDGGHGTGQAEVSFGELWPHLRHGGIYVIEDLEFSAKTGQIRWARRHNVRTTTEWLLGEARGRTYRHWRRQRSHDASFTFWGEACVVAKLPKGV